MPRRKITEEAEQKAEQEQEESSDSGEDDRQRFTLRLQSALDDDVDEWAERHGMSKNAAINFLLREQLDD